MAFSLGGTLYSTGVNDALLTSQGETFSSGDFRALPVSSINGTVTSNTKIGLGALYDGVFMGPSSPPPVNNIPLYLTDGTKGLNLGTGVANLPVGTLEFSVNNVQIGAIGDGKPDILVTQIAQPSTTLDRYEFTDVNGTLIGNFVDVSWSGISSVGTWTADFYEASQNPMTLNPVGFTQTDRDLRLWAADFSSFGINAGNIGSIAKFKITLGGNSDIAFVAYNYTAITVLPVRLSFFKANLLDNDVHLSWQTVSESNTDRFIIEESNNGISFTALNSVAAAGNSNSIRNYSYIHQHPADGHHYYRIKQVDADGHFIYSNIVHIEIAIDQALHLTYLSKNKFKITHPVASNADRLQVWNSLGSLIISRQLQQGVTTTNLDLQNLSAGIYQLVWISNGKKLVHSFLIE